MRKFNVFILCFAGLVMLGCSKSNTDDDQTPRDPLTVTLSKSQIAADGWETTTISVKDQNNTDVTASSTISINNYIQTGSTFWAPAPGAYKVTARYNGATSKEVTITAVDPGPSPFSKKVLVEDFTGTWCGHCPRVGIALENYINAGHPNCIVVAVHGPSLSSDPYAFSQIGVLTNHYQLQGYPSVLMERAFEWDEKISVLNNQFSKRAPLGLSLASSVSGSTVNVTAKVKFAVTTDAEMKLVAYLVEDGKVYPQVNYNYYGLPNPINNYVHNGILRASGTNLLGDPIDKASQVKGSVYSKSFSMNASGYDISKCRIVAFVMVGNNIYNYSGALNVQSAKVGTNKDFD